MGVLGAILRRARAADAAKPVAEEMRVVSIDLSTVRPRAQQVIAASMVPPSVDSGVTETLDALGVDGPIEDDPAEDSADNPANGAVQRLLRLRRARELRV